MSQQLARLTDVSFKTFKQQKTSRMWAQNSWKVFRVVFHCPLSGARRLFVQTGRRLQEFLVMSAGVCLWFYIWWQIGGHLGKRQLRLLIILSSSSTHCSLWIRRDPDYESKLTEVCSMVWYHLCGFKDSVRIHHRHLYCSNPESDERRGQECGCAVLHGQYLSTTLSAWVLRLL